MLHRKIVSAIILSKDQKILFGRKDPKKGGVYVDRWHIPGGGVDEGEDELTALRREIKEETGMELVTAKITPLDSLGSMVTIKRMKDGQNVPCKMSFVVYEVELAEDAAEVEVKENDDLINLTWVPISDLSKYPHTPPSISLFLRLGWLTHEQAIQLRTFRNADEDLIKYTGVPLQWRVSVYAMILKDDQILLAKNEKEKYCDVIGGGVEFGETIEDALARECLEEGGAKIKIGPLVHSKVDWFQHGNGTFYQTLQLFYRAELIGELQQQTEPGYEWVKFVPLHDVPAKYPLPLTVQVAISQL